VATTPELLRAMPALSGLPPEDLVALHCTRVERQRGETFFDQGGAGDAVFGVLTGRIRVVKTAPGGREVCLELLSDGDLFGAVAVMRDIPYPATAIAAEPTACIRVAGDPWKWLIARHPWLHAHIFQVVSQRLLDASQSRLALATEQVETRVAQALLKCAERYATDRGDELVFGCALTRQQLADLAGTTVETTIRVMSRWTKLEYIRSTASRITVMRPDALRRLSDGKGAALESAR
jgi:CRP/FNR family transcriptional regulator